MENVLLCRSFLESVQSQVSILELSIKSKLSNQLHSLYSPHYSYICTNLQVFNVSNLILFLISLVFFYILLAFRTQD